MEKSWKEAIMRVLAESSTPLHYTEISEEILTRGYYETDGAIGSRTHQSSCSASEC
jgi:repressor of nif and glnA expression